jgi:exodeoxyribonuclease V alpha subunit
MSLDLGLELLTEHGVIPPGDDEKAALYAAALDHLGLLPADYLLTRDLRKYAECTGSEVDALLLCLFAALSSGSVCLRTDADSMRRRLELFLPATEVDAAVAAIGALLDAGGLGSLLGTSEQDYTPLIRPSNDLLYFQKYYVAEHALQKTLDAIVDKDTSLSPVPITGGATAVTDILNTVCDSDPVTVDGFSVRLNNEQQLALMAALLKQLLIVSGGPGTGKTSIVIAILRVMVRCGIPPERMKMTAPTGRAAQRMTESIRIGLGGVTDASPDTPDGSLVRLKATTIHRLLGYKPTAGRFSYHQHNRLPADLLIVDEVSMVDVVLMTKLLQALPKTCRVVLLGDRHQLPSVDAGTVLADLMPSTDTRFTKEFRAAARQWRPAVAVPDDEVTNQRLADRIVILRENYRSEQSILTVATAINTAPTTDAHSQTAASQAAAEIINLIPVLPVTASDENADPSPAPLAVPWPTPVTDSNGVTACAAGGCHLMPAGPDSAAPWAEIALSWGRHHYLDGTDVDGCTYRDCVQTASALTGAEEHELSNAAYDSLFRFIDSARVLTLIHSSDRGTRFINRLISDLIRPELDTSGAGAAFAGAPVLITNNDYTKGLFNGDVGVILGTSSRGYRAVFPRLGTYLSFPIAALPGYQPAFAMTVHKSQGSEYDQVLLVLPEDAGHRLLTREIIYTGLTRAKYLVVTYGAIDALQAAIARHICRDSGLDLWSDV